MPQQPKAVGGRLQELNDFYDMGVVEAGLRASEQTVWAFIWRHGKDGLSRLSNQRIERDLNLSKATVSSALKILMERGMLDRVTTGRSGVGISVYRTHPVPPRKFEKKPRPRDAPAARLKVV